MKKKEMLRTLIISSIVATFSCGIAFAGGGGGADNPDTPVPVPGLPGDSGAPGAPGGPSSDLPPITPGPLDIPPSPSSSLNNPADSSHNNPPASSSTTDKPSDSHPSAPDKGAPADKNNPAPAGSSTTDKPSDSHPSAPDKDAHADKDSSHNNPPAGSSTTVKKVDSSSQGTGKETPKTQQPNVPAAKPPVAATSTSYTDALQTTLTNANALWHGDDENLYKRMGNLRSLPMHSGAWGRIYGGEFDAPSTISNAFSGIQIGADRKMNDHWYLGIAGSYTKGHSSSDAGARSDGHAMAFTVYGTKIADNLSYVDLVAKFGRVHNEMSAGDLSGSYRAHGYMLSGEYGKRHPRDNGYFLEPQVQLTYSKLKGQSFQAANANATATPALVTVNDAPSLLGRLSLALGRDTTNSSSFARLSLYHDFKGSYGASIGYAPGQFASYSYDSNRTYWGVDFNGTRKVNKDSYVYGDIEKIFGHGMHINWRALAGVRILFK